MVPVIGWPGSIFACSYNGVFLISDRDIVQQEAIQHQFRDGLTLGSRELHSFPALLKYRDSSDMMRRDAAK